jgi:hypothetical protein
MTPTRARFRRRCRAAALWTLAGVALMQLALGLAVDQGLPEVRDPEYAGREMLLRARLAEGHPGPLVLFVGSSRIHLGVDCATVASAAGTPLQPFNFGIEAGGPFVEELCLRRLRAAGIRPDLVVLEVMPAFLDESRHDQKSLDGARLTVGELPLCRFSAASLRGPLRKWFKGRFVPLQRHQAELRDLLAVDVPAGAPMAAAPDPFGWAPAGHPPEKLVQLRQLALRQYEPIYRNFRPSEEQEGRLTVTVRRCRERGVPVVLLLCPEGSEFRGMYSPAMSREVAAVLGRLRAAFDVPIIDARDWVADDGFLDLHHLNVPGARQFSARLGAALAPLVRDAAQARAR